MIRDIECFLSFSDLQRAVRPRTEFAAALSTRRCRSEQATREDRPRVSRDRYKPVGSRVAARRGSPRERASLSHVMGGI